MAITLQCKRAGKTAGIDGILRLAGARIADRDAI
jgi:hypothetical protein